MRMRQKTIRRTRVKWFNDSHAIHSNIKRTATTEKNSVAPSTLRIDIIAVASLFDVCFGGSDAVRGVWLVSMVKDAQKSDSRLIKAYLRIIIQPKSFLKYFYLWTLLLKVFNYAPISSYATDLLELKNMKQEHEKIFFSIIQHLFQPLMLLLGI